MAALSFFFRCFRDSTEVRNEFDICFKEDEVVKQLVGIYNRVAVKCHGFKVPAFEDIMEIRYPALPY